MRYESLIALRYLRSRRHFGFVTLISLISVVGITIGVAALIVVLSVFNGFGSLVTSILVSFDPHLRIESTVRVAPAAYDSVVAELRTHNDVAGVSPFVAAKALLLARNTTRVVNVKGIDERSVSGVSGLREKIVLGQLSDLGGQRNGIVLGMSLADRLGVIVGDTVSMVSPASAAPVLASMGMPLIRRFGVVGLYETNNKDYDSFYAFVGLSAAQSLFQRGAEIDGIDVRLKTLSESGSVKSWLENRWEGRFRVLTWYDLHRELYTVMQVERWAAYVILSLIVAVASFNLLGSLTMTVIEKTRDIGILKTMGATGESIARVFFTQGLLVGLIGTALGLGLGVGVVMLQQNYHLFPLDPTVYIISALPVEIRWYDLLVVATGSLALSSLAARSPARRAARLIPVEAIRWE